MNLVESWKKSEIARVEATAERLETALHSPIQVLTCLEPHDDEAITRPLAEALSKGLEVVLQEQDAAYTVRLNPSPDFRGDRFAPAVCHSNLPIVRLEACMKEAVFRAPNLEPQFQMELRTLAQLRQRGRDVTNTVARIQALLSAQADYVTHYSAFQRLRKQWKEQLEGLGYKIETWTIPGLTDERQVLQALTQGWEQAKRIYGLAA